MIRLSSPSPNQNVTYPTFTGEIYYLKCGDPNVEPPSVCKQWSHLAWPIEVFLFCKIALIKLKALTGLDRESAHPLQLYAMKRSCCTAANLGATGRLGTPYSQ